MLKLRFSSFNTYLNYFQYILFLAFSTKHYPIKIKSIQAHSLIGCLSNVSKKNNSTIVKLFACFFKFIKVNIFLTIL